MYAARNNHVGCIQELLAARANVDGAVSAVNGVTMSPLLTAITSRSTDAVRVLLQANSSCNTPGYLSLDSQPVLSICLAMSCRSDSSDVICRLLKAVGCQVKLHYLQTLVSCTDVLVLS